MKRSAFPFNNLLYLMTYMVTLIVIFDIIDGLILLKLAILPILILLTLIFNKIIIIIHEFGHFVCGKLTNYSFFYFRIGKNIYIKKNNKIKKHRENISQVIGGQCIMMPSKQTITKKKFFLYNLGGGLFNLITFMIFITIFIFIKNPYIASITLLFATMNFGSFLLNVIPTNFNIANDGYNIRLIKKYPENLNAFYDILELEKYKYLNLSQIDCTLHLEKYLDWSINGSNLLFSIKYELYKTAILKANYLQAREILGELIQQRKKFNKAQENLLVLTDYIHSIIFDKDIKRTTYIRKQIDKNLLVLFKNQRFLKNNIHILFSKILDEFLFSRKPDISNELVYLKNISEKTIQKSEIDFTNLLISKVKEFIGVTVDESFTN